jgi:hypothetical protein
LLENNLHRTQVAFIEPVEIYSLLLVSINIFMLVEDEISSFAGMQETRLQLIVVGKEGGSTSMTAAFIAYLEEFCYSGMSCSSNLSL